MWGGPAAWLWTLVAQAVVTTTSADSGLPLTPEDLALIETLSTPPEGPVPPAPPRLSASARTSGEALERVVLPIDLRRNFWSGDSAVLRGLSGQHLMVTLDGAPLSHPLITSFENPLLGSLAAWRTAAAEVVPSPSRAQNAAPGGEVGLRAAPLGSAPGGFADVVLRSADRSREFHLGGELPIGPLQLRAEGSYAGLDPIRISRTQQLDQPATHAAAALHGALAPAAGSVTLTFGADLDHQSAVPRPELGSGRLDARRDRALIFSALTLDGERLSGLFAAAALGFARQDDQDRREEAGELSARAELRFRISPLFRFGGGLEGRLGRASADGSSHGAAGHLAGEMTTAWISALARARLDYARSAEPGRAVGQLALLPEFRVTLEPARRFAWIFAASRSRLVPTVGDLRQSSETLRPETAWLFESGPRLATDWAWLDLTVYYARVDDALVRALSGPAIENRGSLERYGGEARLVLPGARLGFELALGAAFERAEPAVFSPGGLLRTRLRYRLDDPGALGELSEGTYLAVFARGQHPLSRGDSSGRFARIGIESTLEIGDHLAACVWIENVFDDRGVSIGSALPLPGFDAQIALRGRLGGR